MNILKIERKFVFLCFGVQEYFSLGHLAEVLVAVKCHYASLLKSKVNKIPVSMLV